MPKKILISTSTFGNTHQKEFEFLEKNGYQIFLNPFKRRLSESELISILDDDFIGIIAGLEPITKKTFAAAENLKIISRCGTGIENVDLEYAKKKGIKVFNTPDAATESVAELVVALTLNLLRNITYLDKKIRKDEWNKLKGNLLKNKTYGIIGYGRIGKKVSELIKCFGAKVIVNDINDNSSISVRLNELLERADIVSVHVPLNKSTKNMIGTKELQVMKKSALLINTSRGGIVNEEDLYQSLKMRLIRGAAVDVFEKEPYNGKFLELDNILLTPHIGAYAEETRIIQERESLTNLINGLSESSN